MVAAEEVEVDPLAEDVAHPGDHGPLEPGHLRHVAQGVGQLVYDARVERSPQLGLGGGQGDLGEGVVQPEVDLAVGAREQVRVLGGSVTR